MSHNDPKSSALPARAGDILIVYSAQAQSHVVSVVLKDGGAGAVGRRGVVKSDSYHQAVELALELAQGRHIFSLNTETGYWRELPNRRRA
jgi:hypothetical protein